MASGRIIGRGMDYEPGIEVIIAITHGDGHLVNHAQGIGYLLTLLIYIRKETYAAGAV